MTSGFQTRSVGQRGPRIPRRRTAKVRRWHWLILGLLAQGAALATVVFLWFRKSDSRFGFSLPKLIGVSTLIVILYCGYLWITLPDITDPRNLIASQSTVITDRNGIELYRLFSEEDRTFVRGDTIPQHMKQATIAIEDERFYSRGCLDVRAIARAVFFLGRAGGGSTITRQLARNALDLTQMNRYERKLKEFVLGCQLESRYEKEELLELYLNWIPFGQNAYGIEQASRVYFDTTAADLTLAQSVILASLPQRPSYFSPYGLYVHTNVTDEVHSAVANGSITNVSDVDSEDIRIGLLGGYAGTGSALLYIGGRTDQVLKNMEEQEFITEAERLTALKELEAITFQPARENIRAPHFVLSVRDQVLDILGETSEDDLLERGGLRIETTLDWELQQRAESVIERHWEDLSTRYGAENVALVSLDPETKEVLTYVGNMDYSDTEHGGKIDMVLAARQPGSSFKPFVYAAAFQKGYSPATPLWDVPTKIGEDTPQNFDGQFKGLLTIRKALGASRNLPAAKAYFLAGQEDQILTLVTALGAPTPLQRKKELALEREDGFDYGWPLALGAAETPLLEMVSAYGTLARGGKALPVATIRRVTDKAGNLLYESADPKEDDVLDERIAYQVTSVLSDESARPEEYWKTQLTVPGFQTAAKTGTSNKCLEWKDVPVEDGEPGETQRVCRLRKPDNAWLIGYTPELVTGVWVGNANSASMYEDAGGLNTASPIWRDYMISAHRTFTNPETEFAVPEGIVKPQISGLSGEFPTECTPVAFRTADVFLRENAPSELDPACAELLVDRVTGLLASPDCPRDAAETGSFLVAKSVLPDRWPQWEEGVQEWVGEQMELWRSSLDHSGAVIPMPIAPSEFCDLSLTPGRLEKPSLEVLAPTAQGSVTYPTFRPRLKIVSKADIREVQYRIDGAKVATVSTRPFAQVLRVPSSIDKSGLHTLEVIVVDAYFNEVTSRVRFRFEDDNTAPVLRITKPLRDVTLSKGDTLSIEAEADDTGGIKYVQFYLGDTLLSTKPKSPYALDYTITEKPGTYTLRAVAQDLSKNTTERSLEVTVR